MKEIDNTIQESHCSFEISRLLKEKGFKVMPSPIIPTDYVLGYSYDKEDESDYPKYLEFQWEDCTRSDYYLRPTHTLAIQWLWVNFGVWIVIYIDTDEWGSSRFYYTIDTKDDIEVGEYYDTPQEATEEALLYVLNNLIH